MTRNKLAARMPARRVLRLAFVCAAALLAAGLLSACGKTHPADEPVREGLSVKLGGLHYTVFLTRQLNIKNEEDSGYLPGMEEAAPGRGLYGVFLQACNTGDSDADSTDRFSIVDSQGEKFEPTALDQTNPFAYHAGVVPPHNCEPPRGSLAQLGPTSGALLLFNLPLAATENRPLELHIQGGFNAEKGKPDEAVVTLDI
jgi:hypothetical protein